MSGVLATGVVIALLVTAVPLLLVRVCRGDPIGRLVALESLGVVGTVVLLLMARAAGRSTYDDTALVLALLSFAGSLVFARYWGREL
jgi:multicomponent Na+:H+ antiporter subunit F